MQADERTTFVRRYGGMSCNRFCCASAKGNLYRPRQHRELRLPKLELAVILMYLSMLKVRPLLHALFSTIRLSPAR